MNIQVDRLPFLPIQRKADLPKISAVYFLVSASQVIYVGKTNNLRHRFVFHHKTKQASQKYADVKIAWLQCDPKDLSHTEKHFIIQLNPPLNIQKHNTTRGDSHAFVSVTCAVSTEERKALEKIATDFDQTHGDDPNISKLMRAIADGDLKVVYGDDQTPMSNKQNYAMKAAIAIIQEGLSKLIKLI